MIQATSFSLRLLPVIFCSTFVRIEVLMLRETTTAFSFSGFFGLPLYGLFDFVYAFGLCDGLVDLDSSTNFFNNS